MSTHPAPEAHPAPGHGAPGHGPAPAEGVAGGAPQQPPIRQVPAPQHFDFWGPLAPGSRSRARIIPGNETPGARRDTGVAVINGIHPRMHLEDPRPYERVAVQHAIGAVWAEKIYNNPRLRDAVEAYIPELRNGGWHRSIDPFLHQAYNMRARTLEPENVWHEIFRLIPTELFPGGHVHEHETHPPTGGGSGGSGGGGGGTSGGRRRRRSRIPPINIHVEGAKIENVGNPTFENIGNPSLENIGNPHGFGNLRNVGNARGGNVKVKNNPNIAGRDQYFGGRGRTTGGGRPGRGTPQNPTPPGGAPGPTPRDPLMGPNAPRGGRLSEEDLYHLLGYVPVARQAPPMDLGDAMRRVPQAGADQPLDMSGPSRPPGAAQVKPGTIRPTPPQPGRTLPQRPAGLPLAPQADVVDAEFRITPNALPSAPQLLRLPPASAPRVNGVIPMSPNVVPPKPRLSLPAGMAASIRPLDPTHRMTPQEQRLLADYSRSQGQRPLALPAGVPVAHQATPESELRQQLRDLMMDSYYSGGESKRSIKGKARELLSPSTGADFREKHFVPAVQRHYQDSSGQPLLDSRTIRDLTHPEHYGVFVQHHGSDAAVPIHRESFRRAAMDALLSYWATRESRPSEIPLSESTEAIPYSHEHLLELLRRATSVARARQP